MRLLLQELLHDLAAVGAGEQNEIQAILPIADIERSRRLAGGKDQHSGYIKNPYLFNGFPVRVFKAQELSGRNGP